MIRKIVGKAIYRIPSSAILMFHHIVDNPDVCKSGCKLSFADFSDIIGKFKNYAPLTEVVKRPYKKQIAVTFDDGLKDVYDFAYPFLKEKNIPFTIFTVTDFLDTEGYITSENLKEMANDKLVTIGAHGVTHKNLNTLSATEQEKELNESKRILEEITGKPVNVFAFSHGRYDKATLKLMKAYRYGFSTTQRPLNFITAINRKTLPRFNVDSNSMDAARQSLNKIFKGKS